MLRVGGVASALMPLVVGLLAAFVVYGRRSWASKKNFTRRIDLADIRSA
jgi:hypothetical protein